jgi:hypothetical protein
MARPSVRSGCGRDDHHIVPMKTHLFKVTCLLTCAISCGAACAQDTSRVPDLNQGVAAADPSVHAGVDEVAPQTPSPDAHTVKAPETYSHWGITPSGPSSATQYWPAHASATASADRSTDAKGALPRTSSTRQAGTQPSPSAVSSVHARYNTSAQSESDGKNMASPSSSPSFQGGGKPSFSTVWSFQPGGASLESANTDSSGSSERQPNLLSRGATASAQNAPQGPQHPKTVIAPVSPQSDGFSSPFSGQRQTDGFSSPFSTTQFDSNITSHSLSQPFPQANSSRKRNPGRTREHEHSSQKTTDSTHAGAIARFPNKREKSAGSRAAAKTD